MSVRTFVKEHYRHFNAGSLASASESLLQFLESGGKIFVTLAGAMSTAELGRSIAPMIRAGHIAAISCTGANLEEDLFNLVAHNHYQKIDDWRSLSAQDEADLLDKNMNRVTDTCIPEDKAFRKIESYLMARWEKSSQLGQSKLPHQFFYDILLEDELYLINF